MKGFVHTLEAVIASTMILTMVLVVLPGTSQPPGIELDRALEGLEDLEKQDMISKDISVLKTQLNPFIPSLYNYSITLKESESDYRSVNSPENIYFDKNGSADLQLWIESVDKLNVSFRGQKIVNQRSKTGYVEKNLPASKGWLNFSGTADLDISFNSYIEKGSIPERSNVYTKNFLTYQNNSIEARVAAYR